MAPLVGDLGTFITGSATTSTILFTDFQAVTAHTLEVPVFPMVGAPGFGAAAGNMIAPHNVIAAAAVVGETGNEGATLRTTLWVAGCYLAAGGLVALLVG